MDRSVLLVDAGYLWAQGGMACHGTKARSKLALDEVGIATALAAHATGHCSLPLLRTYWYDGAKRGVATAHHQAIARLPYVKLRLGRLNSQNQQKGVDALIYRDLMTLASERSVAQAYVLSGDDDLREGVLFAQDRGVRVVMIGIALDGGDTCQSLELRHEADEVLVLDKSFVGQYLTCVVPAALPTATTALTDVAIETAAKAFAQRWIAGATRAELNALIAVRPRIPKTLDVEIVRSVEGALGASLRGEPTAKPVLRHAFWGEIDAAHAAAVASEVLDDAGGESGDEKGAEES